MHQETSPRVSHSQGEPTLNADGPPPPDAPVGLDPLSWGHSSLRQSSACPLEWTVLSRSLGLHHNEPARPSCSWRYGGAHQITNRGHLGTFGWGAHTPQTPLPPPGPPSWKMAQQLGSDSRPAAPPHTHPPAEKSAFNLEVLFPSPWKSLYGTN